MTTASDRLNEADACHDDDPRRAAPLLREVDPAQLDPGEHSRLAFLLNHVLGEKLGAWNDAHARQQALLALAGAHAPPVLWRQAAAAARLAGDEAAEARAVAALAEAEGATPAQAAQLVALAATGFRVPRLPAREAGEAVLQVLPPFEHDAAWQRPSGLDASAAACCNNLSADLCERPHEDLGIAALRAAMAATAGLSQRLWQRAGTWVHHERACYQRAIVANTLGEPHRARVHAQAGLALLDANDVAGDEFVDRAFLELELAHASRRLGMADEAAAARARADALAARVGNHGLAAWFASRVARLASLQRG